MEKSFLFSFSFLLFVSGLHLLHTGAPSMPPVLKMDVKCKPWFRKDARFFTVAYTSEANSLGNRLFISRHSEGADDNAVHDYDKDIHYYIDGGTGKCNATKAIPDWQKHEICIPVVRNNVYGLPVFDPNSLVHFDGTNKRKTEFSHEGTSEWENVVTLVAEGKTLNCKGTVTWTWRSSVSPYCEGKSPRRGRCLLVPLVAVVSCADGDIAYEFRNHSVEFDRSLLEMPPSCVQEERAKLPDLTGTTVVTGRKAVKEFDEDREQADTEWTSQDIGLIIGGLIVVLLVTWVCFACGRKTTYRLDDCACGHYRSNQDKPTGRLHCNCNQCMESDNDLLSHSA